MTEEMVKLAPGQDLVRPFVFTRVTTERGDFLIQPIYKNPVGVGRGGLARVYGEPVRFSVEGEEVFAHRYLNGLLTKDDAIGLAEKEVSESVRESSAILVMDEAGFYEWWVNVWYGEAGEVEPEAVSPGEESRSVGPVRSFFVNPYLARVWREAQPFEKADEEGEVPFPKDAEVFDQFRERFQNPAPTPPGPGQ
ncbi:hypothetical protein HQ520_05850 [bacterium]|nr:hypothetical protein [bacterium]